MDKKWIRISIYYLIAIAFTFSLRVLNHDWYKNLSLPFGLSVYKSWIQGMGPLVGAILVTWIFSVKRENTLFGTSRNKSLLMAVVPVLVLLIIGIKNSEDLNSHYYGLIVGIYIIVYAIFEETGWRGYLTDELREIKPLFKYLIIGAMWYIWHFSFLTEGTKVKNELIVFLILVAASWGIGEIAKKTHSVMASGCFHVLGNIMGLSAVFRDNIAQNQKFLIIGLCLIIWIPILIGWDKKTLKDSR